MEGLISPPAGHVLISRFLDIALGQTVDTASHYLQLSDWNLERALQMFFTSNEGWNISSAYDHGWLDNQDPPPHPHVEEEEEETERTNVWLGGSSGSGDRVDSRGVEERVQSWVADDDGGAPNDLATLYRQALALIFRGNFEQAKTDAREQNRWLLVNVQSDTEFDSHLLNRDTWANQAVAEIVESNFVFWQVYNDTRRGKKVCTYYKLHTFPVIMVIDPITGKNMASWLGLIQPEDLLEKLSQFMDMSPTDRLSGHVNKCAPIESYHKLCHIEEDEDMKGALAASIKDVKDIGVVGCQETEDAGKMPGYPPLPEEPKGDTSLLCRVRIRLPPDGRRIQRNFLLSDSIKLLWSFCFSELDEEAMTRPFRLIQAIPECSKCLDYETSLTFEESGLANSMITLTWE